MSTSPVPTAALFHFPRFRFGLVAVLLALATAFIPSAAYAEKPQVPDRSENADQPAVETRQPSQEAKRIEAVVAAARAYLGTPYRVGTEGPSTIDCSGLVFRAFANAGELRQIGGTRLRAAGYLRWFAARDLLTTDIEQVERGDLVMYAHGKHIGLYLGDGRVISALVTGVTVHALNGISMAPTGFLAVDWTGKRGPFQPRAVVPPTIFEVPEAPAALVPGVPWTPRINEEIAAGPEMAGEERVDMRTAYSRTFTEGDGRFTTEVFARPIHYVPEDSSGWQPIDLRFRLPDERESFAALADASPVSLRLQATKRGAALLTARAGATTVGLTPEGAKKEISPEIGEDGRYADYRDLLGTGIGLRVLPRADGFKTFLVLAEEPSERSFRFSLDTGLQASLELDGSVALRDSAGTLAGRIPRPMLLDSSDVEGDGGAVRADAVSVAVETLEDGSVTLVLTVDKAEWEEAAYPAYVDLGLVDFTSASFAAGHTFVSSKHSSGNFSTYQRPESPSYAELWHGRRPGRHDDNEAYLRFPGLAALLAGTKVESAVLAAFPYWQDGSRAPARTWLGRVTQEWDLRTVTWDARPTAVVDAAAHETTQGEWSAIDVSSYVRDAVNGVAPDYGLVLHANGFGRGHWKRLVAESPLASGSLEPRLVVAWSGLRPNVLQTSPAGGTAVDLTWTDAALAPAASQTEVQLSRDGFATIAQQIGLRDEAAAARVVSVSTDRLAPGTYSWRVRTMYGETAVWSDWSGGGTFVVAAAEPFERFTSRP